MRIHARLHGVADTDEKSENQENPIHAGEFLSGVVDQYQGDLMNKWGKNFEGLDKGSNNPISRFLGLSGYN